MYNHNFTYSDYLCHYGVPGMRWGIRKGVNSYWQSPAIHPEKKWHGSSSALPVLYKGVSNITTIKQPKAEMIELKSSNIEKKRKIGKILIASFLAASATTGIIIAVKNKKQKNEEKESKHVYKDYFDNNKPNPSWYDKNGNPIPNNPNYNKSKK